MERLVEVIKKANHVLFITGAGISAESGLPTYRGIGGLYTGFTLIPIEWIMCGWTMDNIPSLTWGHIRKTFNSVKNLKPNKAHKAIAILENLGKKVSVITQNVDGLHKEAGTSNLIEIHGNARSLVCKCGYTNNNPEWEKLPKLPRCPECNKVLRPPVVLFGESLPEKALEAYYEVLSEKPEVVIAIGTTGLFPYILHPLIEAKKYGGVTAVINPEFPPSFKGCTDYWIKENAGNALEYIVNKL